LELKSSKTKGKKFFFALDLYEIAPILPSLMGALFRVIQFLGPEDCALSVIEGRSTDETYEALEKLSSEAKKMGFEYYLEKNDDINPKERGDRIKGLADLRNMALLPLFENRTANTSDAIVVLSE
jgi:alpha-1,3-mannosyltransferase